MDTPEKQLLTPEEAAEDFDSIYASVLEEFSEKNQEIQEEAEVLPSEEPPQTYPDLNAYADKPNNEPPAPRDHSIRNLTILIILELLGIAGVAAWWILYLL